MLKVDQIDVFYGDAQALDSVSLEVPQGAIVAIVGANGAGKTSLIRTIAGMVKPAKGQIRFRDSEIAGLPSYKVCNLGIGQVAEGRQIFPNLTVSENLDMGAMIPRARDGRDRNRERVLAMFPRLRERLSQAAGTLSGGEQQMVAMGRALMANPRLLLLDEPSMGLAPMLIEGVFDMVDQLARNGMTILLVEQNAAAALDVADRAYVLERGRIVGAGDAEALQNSADIQAHYLGVEGT